MSRIKKQTSLILIALAVILAVPTAVFGIKALIEPEAPAPLATTVIDNVKITAKSPEVGEAPSVITADGVDYEIVSYKWLDGENEVSGVFESGRQYSLFVTLKASGHAKFKKLTPFVDGAVSVSEGTVDKDKKGNTLTFKATFPELKAMEMSSKGKSYIAMKNGEYYLVSKFSRTENILVKLGRKGPNKLFEIMSVSFVGAGLSPEDAIKDGGWLLMQSNTDHFGPYGVVAENGYEEYTGTFTGGNHGHENSGDTSAGTKNTPTGRCITLNVYADDVLLTEGNGMYADLVTFDWVNGIQAANTKKPDGSGREVMNEHYHMVFDGEQFNIQNDITALENVTITPYYGNQAVIGWATDGIKYVGNADNKWYPANKQHNSGNQTCSSYIAKKGPYHMQISYDPTYGLGQGTHFGSTPSVMIEAYGKGYFSFFRDNCFVPAGTTHSYRGSYRYFYSEDLV